MTMVKTGLTRLLAGEVGLAGKRVGVIANPTAVDPGLDHIVDLLHAQDGLELMALFGPEHGLRGDAQDMISVGAGRDGRTGLPVHSLYGVTSSSLAPGAETLAELDALVFDIQDVGARYYTYVWTMVHAMRACAASGVELVVLDRPNPIGGHLVEGGDISAGFESFVGLCSLANRHGMTVGEIAGWIRAREQPDVALTVVELRGWRRSMYYEDTGLPWVMPSPNMPTVDTAVVYPGMCLVEGSELSEGRGTTRPFELVGAPFIDGYRLASSLAGEELPGVQFRPLVFTPTFHKFAGQACGGVQLHVTDRQAFLAYRTGVALLRAVHELWPEQFSWRRRAYEFVEDKPAIDLLTGSDLVRVAIDRGDSLADIAASWSAAEHEYARARAEWLLYS